MLQDSSYIESLFKKNAKQCSTVYLCFGFDASSPVRKMDQCIVIVVRFSHFTRIGANDKQENKREYETALGVL